MQKAHMGKFALDVCVEYIICHLNLGYKVLDFKPLVAPAMKSKHCIFSNIAMIVKKSRTNIQRLDVVTRPAILIAGKAHMGSLHGAWC